MAFKFSRDWYCIICGNILLITPNYQGSRIPMAGLLTKDQPFNIIHQLLDNIPALHMNLGQEVRIYISSGFRVVLSSSSLFAWAHRMLSRDKYVFPSPLHPWYCLSMITYLSFGIGFTAR